VRKSYNHVVHHAACSIMIVKYHESVNIDERQGVGRMIRNWSEKIKQEKYHAKSAKQGSRGDNFLLDY